MPDTPETIWARRHMHGAIEAVDYEIIGEQEYRRADLAATNAQAFANENVKALVDAVTHQREMVCQDMGMQMEADKAVDDALAAMDLKQ